MAQLLAVRPHHTLTASEAIEICRLKAGELNYPWSSETAVARRRRVWPFPPFWRVVTYVQRDNFTLKMVVDERSSKARPVLAIWAVSKPQPVHRRVFLSSCIKLVVSGCLFWLFARYMNRWPIWGATLFAIPCSYAGLIFYQGIVDRIKRSKYDKAEETDEA